MNELEYKKRRGTSGVSGQLYETKLLSLILFRALHDDDIEEFYIGTNVDGLGEFDDICLRFKVKGFDKPIAVFLQAKHRDDQNRPLKVTKKDLTEYFKSYMNVRSKFNVNSSDALFRGAYDDVECAFVFYTNTKAELDKEYQESEYISKINDVISTGDDAFQLSYTDNDFNLLNQMVMRDIIGKLAIIIADIVRVKGENYKNLMRIELMQAYHVILSQRVFTFDSANDVNTKYRVAQINETLIDSTDGYLHLLGKGLVEALKDNNVIQYVDENVNEDGYLKEIIHSLASFKLPVGFGNRDLNLSGDISRKEKQLCYLANKLINLLKESNVHNVNDDTFNIVYIDDTFPDKFIERNGGIADAVGNLLIFDSETRLLMFQDGNHLTGHAKTLFDKIKSEVEELEKYRLDVRLKNFPKLSFDCNEHEKSMVVDFTNRLLLYTNQAREGGVEDILKREIGRLQTNRERCNFQITSDAIFLAYHDEIQKWWLQQNNARYLTKTCHVFQNSIERFIRNPLLSVASFLSENKMMKHNIKVDTKVVNSLELDESFSKITIIVSEVIALSVVKVTQYIKNDDYLLLDLNYMLNLPASDCDCLHDELTNVEDKIIILTYRLSQVSKLNKDIKDILKTLKRKKLIVVTNNGSVSEIKKFLAHTDIFVVNDKSSLADLTKESQETITKNTDVIFQSERVKLSQLVDDDARVFIKGELLNKIMSGEVIQVGGPVTTARYEEIKQFYVSRRVTSQRNFYERNYDNDIKDEENDDENDSKEEEAEENGDNVQSGEENGDNYSDGDNDDEDSYECTRKHHVEIKLDTFYDIDEHAVLITADPGMGKSSLLTHLSLATKARDPGVWIVRIDLLDYSRFFHQWTENKAVTDIVEALRFICIALFKLNVNEKLIANESNGIVFLKDFCKDTDIEIIFQINMFLHHCSRRKVIFAFDGFDEICPHYEPQVIQFLNVLKRYRPREHRVWITSRTYSKILRSLESVFDVSHQLVPFDFMEQEQFIQRYFKIKLNLNELNEKQIEKINDFIAFIDRSWWEDMGSGSPWLHFREALEIVYRNTVQYIKYEIKHVKVQEKYVKVWDFNVDAMKNKYMESLNKNQSTATPLHIYIVADYFQQQIKRVETETVWDLNLNSYAMYEYYVETKYRKIRSEEKNQMDLYKPDVKCTYERDKKEFINEHKKLAAYAMFHEHVDQLFSETELEEIRKAVRKYNSGQEKTGIIHTVTDGVPRFVHRTFAEYFAAEYICDKLKMEQSDDDLKSVWNFILNTVFVMTWGVLHILNDKLIIDDELKTRVNDARSTKIISDVLKERLAGADKAAQFSHYALAESFNLRNFISLFPPIWVFAFQIAIEKNL